MKALSSKLAALSSTLLPSHIISRDEGHIWTTPQDSINGSFIFPRTYPLTFREGSSINISWSKSYTNINLYFYQRGKVANSVQLVTNLATDWYQWNVRAEERNLTSPFVFRIVNAQGTHEEQISSGFWSTSWYLTRDDSTREFSTKSSSVVLSTTVSSSTASSTSAISLESTPSPTPETKTEATAASRPTAEMHSSGVSKSATIGLIVGLVVAGAIIVAGLFSYLRKRGRSKEELPSPSLPTASYYDKVQIPRQLGSHPAHEVFVQPSELQGISPCYELPEKS